MHFRKKKKEMEFTVKEEEDIRFRWTYRYNFCIIGILLQLDDISIIDIKMCDVGNFGPLWIALLCESFF